MPAYTTSRADVRADRERILALWRSGLTHGGGKYEEKFDWFYTRNPEGAPVVLFLHADGAPEPVGVIGLGTRSFLLEGMETTGGMLVDFVVAEAHRSFFPAVILQRAMVREGQKIHAIVFGMPNHRAEPVMARAGSKRVGQVVRRVHVVRAAGFLARYMPRFVAGLVAAVPDRVRMAGVRALPSDLTAEWLDRPDARFDDLWARASRFAPALGRRDAAFLAWRFSDCPLASYRFLAITAGAARKLVAYAVCGEEDGTLAVHDFLCDPEFLHARPRLWDEVVREAWRSGRPSASIEVMGPPALHAELERRGWVARRERPFVAAVGERKALLEAANWHATPADEDG